MWACTALVSVLSFTGPAYMLLLYGYALPGADARQWLLLTVAMLALYAAAGCIDAVRQHVFARRASAIDDSVMASPAHRVPPVQELDHLASFLAGPAPAAMCDLPFVPIYLAGLCWLHPLLGAFGATAAIAVGALMVAGRSNATANADLYALAQQRAQLAAQLANVDPDSAAKRFARGRALKLIHRQLRDRQQRRSYPESWRLAMLRALRPALQSAMLGLGAYLAATGACHPVSALAAAVLLPRVIGPVEIAVGQRTAIAAAVRSAGVLAAHSPFRRNEQTDQARQSAQVYTLNSSMVVKAIRSASDHEAERLRKYSSS